MDTPYRGGFAPVTEEITAFDLPVTGRIPAEFTGRYLRNGPNPLSLDDPQAAHLFTGEGMVHGVRLRDGKAEWYRNRWVRNAETARRLGEEPRPGPVHEGFDFAANTHVFGHAGRTLAAVEAGALPYELSFELDTVGPCDFGGTLPGGFAAHTKLDPHTGELHAIAYFFGWDHHQHVVVGKDGTVTHTQDIPIADAPMVHDLALTERYVILYDLPVTFSMDAAGKGAALPYAWNEEHGSRIGLLSRATGEMRWVEVDPCWVFHTVNAYDLGEDQVVIDVVRYPKRFVEARLDQGGSPTLDRWTIDVPSGKVTETRLDDRPQEFPRIDERLTAAQHRFAYTAAGRDLIDVVYPAELEDLPDEAFDNTLIKHDLGAGTQQARQFGRGAYVGEPVFVPAGEAEDDGYVMALVNNPDRGAADLVIVSAQDFAAPPVATVHLPARVPLGFHGSWVTD